MAEAVSNRISARAPRGKAGAFRRLRTADEIEPYLSDAARFPGGHASEVCLPRTEADVAEILRASKAVLVSAARSSLTGGATPRGETVVSTEHMDWIGEPDAGEVRCGAGVVLRILCERLRTLGLYYPPVPTYDGASVGGTVATNAAGAATFKYGSTRAWVEGLTVVLAGGDVLDLRRGACRADAGNCFEIAHLDATTTRLQLPTLSMPKVPKSSAGYFVEPGMDLIDLFIGSEGTLGVVTEVVLRVCERPPAMFTAWVPVADESGAVELSLSLREASLATRAARDPNGIDVAAIEYVDARSLALLREDGAFARLGLSFPDGCGAAVLFQAELPASTTTKQAYAAIADLHDSSRDGSLLRLCRLLEARGVFASALPALPGEDDKAATLFALREAVPEAVNRRIADASRASGGAVTKAAADVIVPFERLQDALARYRRIAEESGLEMAVWGHISDGNLHPNLLPTNADETARAKDVVFNIGRTAIELGGSPMSEHGVGRNEGKKRLLRVLYGEDGVTAMRGVKDALDPKGVLAPGVIF